MMNKIKCENTISIKDQIETKDYFYIIMDLCNYNLKEYIKMREKPISVEEIKYVLLQLNNAFKIMNNKKINHTDIKLNNILISQERLDKNIIKLSSFCSSKGISNSMSFIDISLTSAPEILLDEEDLSKSDLWSIGIIIYYMYFKEYPYKGKNEHILLNDIKSGKKLKSIDDKELDDLMNKLLKININERLSWEEYFNHNFFKQNNLDMPIFNFKCEEHFKDIKFYCQNCKLNICIYCLEKHNNHKIVSFYNIGLNDDERNKFETLFKYIENNINTLNQIKNNYQSFYNKIGTIKENVLIYKNDTKNNYKNYYIEALEKINEQLKYKFNINFINLEDNYIICEYDIKKDELNKPIQILNSYEESKKKYINRRLK